MDPVSGVDRLVALLNQRLQTRTGRQARFESRPSSTKASGGLDAVRALAAAADQDPNRFRRALIEMTLVNRFGDEAVNDARFQQIVNRVTAALSEDEDGRRLFDDARRELLNAK